jgi:isopenicillin-N N-acyltransferase-like protein
MIDVGFPIIKYPQNKSPLEWGRAHGESFRTAIGELAAIRGLLLREKNPNLTDDHIASLADAQWQITRQFDRELAEELSGIAGGANLSITDLVILNNYTDFRDIQVTDQGCSLVYINYEQGPIAGQTWDMHGSAKNYVCVLDIEDVHAETAMIVFSLVGCVGLTGYNDRGAMIGVNNINTKGARPGVMWPAMVRSALKQTSFEEMVKLLVAARKTSGHNYLVAAGDQADMWEVAPDLSERVDHKRAGEWGYLFHTNHCLGPKMALRETAIAQNSTTHIRYDLLKKKIGSVQSYRGLYELLNDHENYPQSICSNYQSGSQDPSITCGGAIGHLSTGEITMWRGDKLYDANFVEHRFGLNVGMPLVNRAAAN